MAAELGPREFRSGSALSASLHRGPVSGPTPTPRKGAVGEACSWAGVG